MGMGFTRQYFGTKPDEVEGMLALIEYIALAEIVEKDRGTSKGSCYKNVFKRNYKTITS